ncbi:hypothetical protein [Burkholderia sp. 22PA0106]|uniref:hypothetical protein n=1 Tax=Burkholderia sp. 22PA0106 TaxID=3237371 RepID=UPI0039C41778
MKNRYTDVQIIRVLRESERHEEPVNDLCKRHNITEQTLIAGETNSAAWTCPKLVDSKSSNEGLGAERSEAPPAPASLRQRYSLTPWRLDQHCGRIAGNIDCNQVQGLRTFRQVGHFGFRRRMVNGRSQRCLLPLTADILHVLRRGIYRCSRHAVAARRKRRPRVHRTWQPLAERICRTWRDSDYIDNRLTA